MLDTKATTAQPQPSNLTSQSECNSNEVPLIDSRLDHSTVVPVINSITLKYDFLFQIIESLCWCQVSNELVKSVFILNNWSLGRLLQRCAREISKLCHSVDRYYNIYIFNILSSTITHKIIYLQLQLKTFSKFTSLSLCFKHN